jgi:hypothetical protein
VSRFQGGKVSSFEFHVSAFNFRMPAFRDGGSFGILALGGIGRRHGSQVRLERRSRSRFTNGLHNRTANDSNRRISAAKATELQ